MKPLVLFIVSTVVFHLCPVTTIRLIAWVGGYSAVVWGMAVLLRRTNSAAGDDRSELDDKPHKPESKTIRDGEW